MIAGLDPDLAKLASKSEAVGCIVALLELLVRNLDGYEWPMHLLSCAL